MGNYQKENGFVESLGQSVDKLVFWLYWELDLTQWYLSTKYLVWMHVQLCTYADKFFPCIYHTYMNQTYILFISYFNITISCLAFSISIYICDNMSAFGFPWVFSHVKLLRSPHQIPLTCPRNIRAGNNLSSKQKAQYKIGTQFLICSCLFSFPMLLRCSCS